MVTTGRCWCEKVKYEYDGAPIRSVQCFCITCQKISGAPFTVNAMVASKNVRVTSGKEHLKIFTGKHVLGADLDVYFCDICASNVWKELKIPDQLGLWVIQTGTLDPVNGKMGVEVAPPEKEAFTSCRPEWLPQVPNLEALNPPEELVAKCRVV